MTTQVDYKAAFKSLPGAVALLGPDLVILDVSNGYLDAAGCAPEEIVGRHILEAFPENPRDPEDAGPRDLKASLEQVLATNEPDLINPIRYDVEVRGNPGEFEERYWTIANTPVCTEDGQVCMIVHMAQEVTHLVHASRAENC
ncbi:MAG TPA: PAS domain-containing protein [Streptosporangiaceae bacterium]|nr:PAS domain-containing protein [Streptosporangiaceae bacterium]